MSKRTADDDSGASVANAETCASAARYIAVTMDSDQILAAQRLWACDMGYRWIMLGAASALLDGQLGLRARRIREPTSATTHAMHGLRIAAKISTVMMLVSGFGALDAANQLRRDSDIRLQCGPVAVQLERPRYNADGDIETMPRVRWSMWPMRP